MMTQPEDVVTAWEAAWNAGDADAIADLFADDADFVNVVGLWWHNREDIRVSHEFGFTTIFPGSTMSFRTPRVRVLGDAAAVIQCRWHLVGQVAPDGSPAGDREGIFTFVMERRDGGWIAVAAQNADAIPGTQTHLNSDAGQSAIYYAKPGARGER